MDPLYHLNSGECMEVEVQVKTIWWLILAFAGTVVTFISGSAETRERRESK